MSTSTALALIIATSCSGLFCFYYITRMATDLATEIVTGVAGGIPISTKYRWILLHQTWVSYVIGAVGSAVVVTVVNVKVADYVIDAGVKPMAYLFAFFSAVAAFSWLVEGISEYLFFRSVLRETKRD